jgi:AcrR family transcriptional regulator
VSSDGLEGVRERKTRETRERIFREAVALFERHGFAGTKVRDIAERAKVSTVTVHSHFRTKDRILHALAELYFERAISLFEEMAELAADASTPPQEFIDRARQTALDWPTTGRQLAADTQRIVIRTETGDRLYREMRSRLALLIGNLQRSGKVRGDLDATVLAAVLGDLILGALTSWSTDLSDAQPPAAKVGELVSFLVSVLVAPRE